ncbi:unnamed protein product [Fusarium graminearum]|uniref:Chromosome 2, complete genome n=1 Tax=Gibberella zeae (strain ATCC MYA-4620 / CBS 123657 / FGSC 9075 / NRRL 31084 / PH-1) TaxID=229533 RepID=A0A098DGX7_GIBZE|nr:unnamed protein product [Fusarium graminearum]
MPFVCHFVEFLCLFEFGCCSEACASPALSTSYSTPVELIEEINATREQHLDISALQDLRTFEDENLEYTVPFGDETYKNLGVSLLVHNRTPVMSLLRFETFDGLEAFQPCSPNIDQLNLQKALRPIETGDPVFNAARDWSCILQSLPGLPKELRWILATVYDLACVMLRADSDEDAHWAMRPWLSHWYDVADILFLKYNIPATAPDPD